MQKALREAKRHTSWINPNEALRERAPAISSPCCSRPEGASSPAIVPLAQDLSARGMLNGLDPHHSESTLPGVPDFYQGTEFWDFSLVDPDNRRPVDYGARAATLGQPGRASPICCGSWPDGRIKQHLIATLLADRAASPELYSDGTFEPVPVRGAEGARLVCFLRRRQRRDAARRAAPARCIAQLADLRSASGRDRLAATRG